MIDPLDKSEFMACMEQSETVGDYSEYAANRFWDWMYAEQDGLVQLCCFPVPTEGKTKSEMGDGKWQHVTEKSHFLDFCSTHSGLWRYHVYSGVNTLDKTPEYGRGGVEHIDTVNTLSFDIELAKDSYKGSTKEEVWWTYQYALAEVKFIMEEYGVYPLVVMSENGIHMHYKVDFECRDELLEGKQHIYSKFITHQAMNSDYVSTIKDKAPSHIEFDQDDVSDIPRVMKVAGTKGIKSEYGRLCGIIHEPPSDKAGVIQESDVDVDKSVINSGNKSSSSGSGSDKPVSVEPEDIDSGTMDKVKRHAKNDETFGRYWRGELNTYDSRSEAEFGFIIKMLNHGFTESEIQEVMWASGMTKWAEESDHYRRRTIENALDYFDGNVTKDSKDGTFSFT